MKKEEKKMKEKEKEKRKKIHSAVLLFISFHNL